MKLTPLDVQQQQFPRRALGYDKEEVRTFLEFVGREYQEAITQLAAREEEVRRQQDELFRLREREEMLKEALVTAQRLSEDMRVQAKKEADLVVAEAEMKGERIVHHAHSRLLAILEEITDLKRQRVQMQESLRAVLATHQKLLDVEPVAAKEPDEQVSYLGPKKMQLDPPTLAKIAAPKTATPKKE